MGWVGQRVKGGRGVVGGDGYRGLRRSKMRQGRGEGTGEVKRGIGKRREG